MHTPFSSLLFISRILPTSCHVLGNSGQSIGHKFTYLFWQSLLCSLGQCVYILTPNKIITTLLKMACVFCVHVCNFIVS